MLGYIKKDVFFYGNFSKNIFISENIFLGKITMSGEIFLTLLLNVSI